MAKPLTQLVREYIVGQCRKREENPWLVDRLRSQVYLTNGFEAGEPGPDDYADGDIRRVIDEELEAVARFVEQRQGGGPR